MKPNGLMARLPHLLLALFILALFYLASLVVHWGINRLAFNHRRHNLRTVAGPRCHRDLHPG